MRVLLVCTLPAAFHLHIVVILMPHEEIEGCIHDLSPCAKVHISSCNNLLVTAVRIKVLCRFLVANHVLVSHKVQRDFLKSVVYRDRLK